MLGWKKSFVNVHYLGIGIGFFAFKNWIFAHCCFGQDISGRSLRGCCPHWNSPFCEGKSGRRQSPRSIPHIPTQWQQQDGGNPTQPQESLVRNIFISFFRKEKYVFGLTCLVECHASDGLVQFWSLLTLLSLRSLQAWCAFWTTPRQTLAWRFVYAITNLEYSFLNYSSTILSMSNLWWYVHTCTYFPLYAWTAQCKKEWFG